ncbi:MAG: TIGR01777 family oxidoreductase [Solirubrobacterales bacterium]
MKILVSGATGFIGKPLVAKLRERGDEVVTLTRGPDSENAIHWDLAAGELDPTAVGGFDAIVHLAGESIAGLWTAGKKRAIMNSRRDGTEMLATAAADASPKPGVFVSSSAIGFYGSRGDETLTEESENGEGFLAEVVKVWEDSAQPARDAGIRTVNLRLGLVLADGGGMMAKVKPLFKLGGGGKLGSGEQWWSWVTLDDVVGAFVHAIDTPTMNGPFNVVAPNPVTNAEFTKALGSALRRPTFLPAPRFALKVAAGEMADEMLLSSQRGDASKLLETGFAFRDSQLPEALERLFA